jgi:hypothetical protein
MLQELSITDEAHQPAVPWDTVQWMSDRPFVLVGSNVQVRNGNCAIRKMECHTWRHPRPGSGIRDRTALRALSWPFIIRMLLCNGSWSNGSLNTKWRCIYEKITFGIAFVYTAP